MIVQMKTERALEHLKINGPNKGMHRSSVACFAGEDVNAAILGLEII
jgi:hypothetical protein